MAIDPAKVAETVPWFRKAASDLRAAAHEFKAEPPLLDDIVFHCQQAVEKSLKGFLTWHDRPFRKTHDLGEIGKLCVDIAPELEPLLRRAAPLTEYAWKFRYPGETGEPARRKQRRLSSWPARSSTRFCRACPRSCVPEQ